MNRIKTVSIKDTHSMKDEILFEKHKETIQSRIKAGPRKTKITIKDPDSGKVLGVFENKVVISGSAFAGSQLFGINPPFHIPNYNTSLGLEYSVEEGTIPINTPIICLFCVGDVGCGEKDSDVYTAGYVDRIKPDALYPFRYVDDYNDISDSEREIYFGRKVYTDEEKAGKIGYYFKKFDNTPQMFLRYTDGTELTGASIYSTETTQDAECFVQLDLLINRLDFRDYFDQVIGWDKARVSSLSLCSAWYTENDGFKYYQDIIPFTKLNFSFERLVDNTKSLAFEYALFF